ncbi:MAG: hypothetical protein UY83_C0016G0009 [Candidatus Adlerbacteria bacterium GW2011_GWA1_54_10]|uniref:Uncharacterized protein n=1 Tax=Candidatus Adlerbacteria bacterium GW2011_GWA1_54_10 TaxID=1618605 RepID=A0A0G2A2V3_9BACT|nr:MAG: hypothetical protein UY83_C0016G0009 [Candidatus Adlerbacteria bacterium GW2011_GWA1_54_10]
MKRVAETEQQAVAERPLIGGIGPGVEEPRPAVVLAFDVEYARVAVRVRSRFGRDPQDFAFRLVLVLDRHVRPGRDVVETDSPTVEVDSAPVSQTLLVEQIRRERGLGESVSNLSWRIMLSA